MDCCTPAELSRSVTTLYVFVILVTDGGNWESENAWCSVTERKTFVT